MSRSHNPTRNKQKRSKMDNYLFFIVASLEPVNEWVLLGKSWFDYWVGHLVICVLYFDFLCVCCVCLVVNICIWPPIGIFTVHLPGIKLDPPATLHTKTLSPTKHENTTYFERKITAQNIKWKPNIKKCKMKNNIRWHRQRNRKTNLYFLTQKSVWVFGIFQDPKYATI